MIGGFDHTNKEQMLSLRNTMAYNTKILAAKRRIFDALTKKGIDLFKVKHKKRVEMFCDAYGFKRPSNMRWQDYIIQLYENKQLPDPIPKKRKEKSEYQKQQEAYEQEQLERKKRYRDYINSDQWKSFRLKALEHFGNRCGLCDQEGKMDLHHKHYKNFMNETFADVIPLCRKCHQRHHNKF